ncbi:MAG: putative protein tyrosine phosphatase [Myxococcota bacterium]|jgi:predicted protein tyrosine phosphatase
MDVVICGWAEVRTWFWEWDFEHVVSIGEPDDPLPEPLDANDPRVLRLEFMDTAPFDDFTDDGPQWEHVAALVTFCERIRTLGGATLIHCAAGVSRSSASALTLLAMAYGPGREVAAVRAIAGLPGGHRARPNTAIIRLADEILERDGVLLAALDAEYYDGVELL